MNKLYGIEGTIKVGILGGGLTGLAVAVHLDLDHEVLEKEDRCGGHCRSLQEQGFTFDIGGAHIIYSRDQQILDYMVSLLDNNVRRRRRNNKIFYKGRYVKYPFENGLYDLDPQDRFECLYYYLKNDYAPPTNFKEWLHYTFGKGITEKYLLPYNEKIWGVSMKEMSIEWVEGRVPKPSLEEVVKSAVGVETEGYTHQLYFYYPLQGGIEALPRALERRVVSLNCLDEFGSNVSPLNMGDMTNTTPTYSDQGRAVCPSWPLRDTTEKRTGRIITGFTVRRIYKDEKRWVVSDGKVERRYDWLVSTIPIQDLVAALQNVPDDVVAAVNALRYNSLITVMLGLNGGTLRDYTAIYFPNPEIEFHRLSLPGVFSPYNAPEGKSAVMAEITASIGDRTWEMSDGKLIDHVIAVLAQIGFIDPDMVCYKRVMRLKYAYIIHDFAYRRNMEQVKKYIHDLGITLVGRMAEFEYINMDESIHRGVETANRLNNKFRGQQA